MNLIFNFPGSRKLLSLSCWVIILLAPFSPSIKASQSSPLATVRVRTHEEAGNPVAGVLVELKLEGSPVRSLTTSERGEAEFANLAPGTYEIVISKEGFESLKQSGIAITAETPVEVEFTLVPKIEVKESINVNESAPTPLEQGGSPSTELQRTQVKNLPNRPTEVIDVLPLIPGVVRTPDDEIRISGSSEHSSAFIVNSADVTEPATGRFGVSVPVDSVETINVFKTPYLAQYGRFTAGVVSVETRRGGEKWHFEFNDPLPEFRIRSGHLRGLRDTSPRITFNGPLIANRFYLSQGIEYALHKLPVRTLSFPFNETKQESTNSFTQFDYILSPTHLLTGTFHLAPRRTNYVNLEFFNPQPVTPSFRAHDYTGTIIERLSLGSDLLESLLAIKRYSANVWGQGPEEMVLTPTGNRGNYFSQQDRQASRVEWLETLSLRPISHYGTHNLKFGSTLARTANRGEFTGSPVDIQDSQGRLLKRIEFVNGKPFDRSDLEMGFFGQDHWLMGPKVALDLGMRFERQGITETFRIGPRIGLAWTPFSHQQTVIRSGFGLFYDRVPLSVYAFDRYPEQLITTYGANGEIVDGPRRFINITDRAEGTPLPFILRKNIIGNFAPYNATWNVEAEHTFSHSLRIRANYLQSNSYGMVIVTPKVVQGQDVLVQGGGGRSRYPQLELTARFSWK
ncbi:MAG: hypothetical protein DMG05_15700, partial [Acidobacteria bacterium]